MVEIKKAVTVRYNVRDSSGAVQSGVTEVQKDALVSAGGTVISTIRTPIGIRRPITPSAPPFVPATSPSDLVLQSRLAGLEQSVQDQLKLFSEGSISEVEFDARKKALEDAHLDWYTNFQTSGATGAETASVIEARAVESAAQVQSQVEQILAMEVGGEISHEQSVEAVKRVQEIQREDVRKILSGEDVKAGESGLVVGYRFPSMITGVPSVDAELRPVDFVEGPKPIRTFLVTVKNPVTGVAIQTEEFTSLMEAQEFISSLSSVPSIPESSMTYSVGVMDPDTGTMRTETFDTPEAAHRYAEVFRVVPQEQLDQQSALRRLTEDNIVSISDGNYVLSRSISTLNEKDIKDLNTLGFGLGFAEVSTELGKPRITTIDVSDEGMEDLLMRGKLEAGQVVQAFRTGDFNVAVVVQPEDVPVRNLFRSWTRTALDWNIKANDIQSEGGFYDPSIIKPSDLTPQQMKARTEYHRFKVGAGILNVVAATLNPATYALMTLGVSVAVGKGAVALATDPVGALGRVLPGASKALAVTGTRIRNDYKADPVGFANTLFGSIVGNIAMSYAIGKTWSTIKPSVIRGAKGVSGSLGKLRKIPKQIDDLLFKPYLDDEWMAFQRTSLAQKPGITKDVWMRAIPDEYFAGTADLFTGDIPSFMGPDFIKGLPVKSSLWDEFRAWSSRRPLKRAGLERNFYPFIPIEAETLNPAFLNDFKTFIKQRSAFIRNLDEPEFYQTFGKLVKWGDEPKGINLLDEAFAFYTDKKWIVGESILNTKQYLVDSFEKAKMYYTISQYIGPATTEIDRMAVPGITEWMLARKPKGSAFTKWEMFSPADQKAAMEFFGIVADSSRARAFINRVNRISQLAGGFDEAVQSAGLEKQVAIFADSVTRSGVSDSLGLSLVSEYAYALTAIYMAENAVTREIAEVALKDAISAIMGMSNLGTTSTIDTIMTSALSDIESRMKLGIISDQFQGFNELSVEVLDLRSTLDQNNMLDSGQIQDLYEGILHDFGLTPGEITKIDPIETTVIKSDIIPIVAPVFIPPDEQPIVKPPVPIQELTPRQLEEGRLEVVPTTGPPMKKKLTRDELRRRRRANRILPSRKRESYRVTFLYVEGGSEVEDVSARSFPDAYSIARRSRESRLVPVEVEVEKL